MEWGWRGPPGSWELGTAAAAGPVLLAHVRCLPRMLGVGGMLSKADNYMRVLGFGSPPVALAVLVKRRYLQVCSRESV